MKKLLVIISIFSIFIITLGAHKLILALNIGETVVITGNNLLPNLFYEHNLYNHITEYGEVIYCLDPDKIGTETSSYQGNVVSNLELYSNQQIAILSSAITNGYPNLLPGSPFRNFTPNEYHSITAMAIRAICMEFKGMTRGMSAENYINVQHGESAAKLECAKLIVYAKNHPYNERYNQLSVKCLSEDNIVTEDNTKVGKEYILEGSNISGPISISTIDNNIDDIILPQNLNIGEKFYIMIPKDKTFVPINKTMVISGKANSGLLFIKAGMSNRQNYMGVLKVNQDIKTTFDFKIEPNIAKLKIIKKDIETEEILPRTTFRIWSKKPKDVNDSENLLGTFMTNEVGTIEINNLDELGTYYISEICNPIGYVSENESIFENITVEKYGVAYNKTIFNQPNIILENFIQINGYKQVASKQFVQYKVYGATNASSVSLNNLTINITIPNEYYELNNCITIGEFEDKQGYLMYLIDNNNNQKEIKKSYNDDVDNLLSRSLTKKTINIKGIFNSNDSELITVPETGIKELVIKLASESKGIEFKTPVFGKGNYSIYIKDSEKEYLLGSNYDGSKEHKFECRDLRSYRIVFNQPIYISNFKSGAFTANTKCNENYSVIIDTDKRENVLINNNYKASERNILRLTDFRNNNLLSDGEIIKNVSIIFNASVKPGLSLVNPIILTGISKDLKIISKNTLKGNGNNLNYTNLVEISGEYKRSKVQNGDEWDTGSYSKEVQLKKGILPKTGTYKYLILGLIPLFVGIILVFKWRYSHE